MELMKYAHCAQVVPCVCIIVFSRSGYHLAERHGMDEAVAMRMCAVLRGDGVSLESVWGKRFLIQKDSYSWRKCNCAFVMVICMVGNRFYPKQANLGAKTFTGVYMYAQTA